MRNGRKQRLVSCIFFRLTYDTLWLAKGACCHTTLTLSFCHVGLPEVPVEDVSSRRSSPRLRAQRDTIRDQENAVLDIFSQESFFKVRQHVAPLFFIVTKSAIDPSSRYRVATCVANPAACT